MRRRPKLCSAIMQSGLPERTQSLLFVTLVTGAPGIQNETDVLNVGPKTKKSWSPRTDTLLEKIRSGSKAGSTRHTWTLEQVFAQCAESKSHVQPQPFLAPAVDTYMLRVILSSLAWCEFSLVGFI